MHRCDTTILVLLITVLVISRDAAAAIIRADDNQQPRDTTNKHSITTDAKSLDIKHPARTDSEQSVNMNSESGQKVVNKVESSLLNMFGLKSRPQPKDTIQVPQYMIDLYKQEAGITGEVQLNLGFRSSVSNVRKYPGNTIRSFYHEGNYTILVIFN